MDETTKREKYELVGKEEETLDTNADTKATDVLVLIAVACAATGVKCLIDKLKRRKAKKSKDEFQKSLIETMFDENCSFESINKLNKKLKEYL